MLARRDLPVDLERQAQAVFEGVKRTVAAAMQVEVIVEGRGRVLQAPPGKRRPNHVRATTVPIAALPKVEERLGISEWRRHRNDAYLKSCAKSSLSMKYLL